MSSTITVPEGMSCVNALYALWTSSKHTAYLKIFNIPASEEGIFLNLSGTLDHAEEKFSTADKVAKIFKKNTNFDYVNGRVIKIDFSTFPQLDIWLYDRDFGDGAAKKALDEYNKIPSSERLDKYDSYNFENLTKV